MYVHTTTSGCRFGAKQQYFSYLVYVVALKRACCCCWGRVVKSLTAESVQGASLPLEGVDHVHGGDSLPLGVFGVGDGIPDDVLKEHLEHATGLLVDEARDTLDSTTASQTPDGGLGDALDVVPQHLAVPLGASLSQSLASFAASSHDCGSDSTDGVGEQRTPIYTRLPSPYWSESLQQERTHSQTRAMPGKILCAEGGDG